MGIIFSSKKEEKKEEPNEKEHRYLAKCNSAILGGFDGGRTSGGDV